MIVLFCDFGLPYTAQMKAAVRRTGTADEIVDLLTDAPPQGVKPSAYLLPALASDFAEETVFVCVVDPGVGGERGALAVRADNRWFVGPDNGLFEMLLRRAPQPGRCWDISWRPERLSSTFHGRDVFAPVAGRLAQGETPPGPERPAPAFDASDWPDELAEIVYIDGFGNAFTGIRTAAISKNDRLTVNGHSLSFAATYSDVQPGHAFWYENAIGLAEIAVNGGNAAAGLGLSVGVSVGLLRQK
ncbi:MAG: SAM-dependent chlorinase/fluorinase [Rhodospirillales bacterium]